MIGPKLQPPIIIQELVLSLIEKWALMFQNRSDMKVLYNFYLELKQKGIEFPVDIPNKDQEIKLSANSTSVIHEAASRPGNMKIYLYILYLICK